MARLVKAEIASPYYGIFINTSVGNPTVLRERFLRNRQVLRLRRRRSIPEVFIKEPRAVFLCHTSPKPPQPRVLAPKVRLHCFQPSHHVRIQLPRPMGGFLRHRGGYCKASGGQIPDRGDPPQATCSRTGYSDLQIWREVCIHLSLPPRARVRSPPLRPGVNVLLRTRFSRPSSGFLPPHLGVYHHV